MVATLSFIILLQLLNITLVRGQSSACGGAPLLLGTTSYNGEFVSPNYPNNYPNGAVCEWNITVPDKQLSTIIELKFLEFTLVGQNDVIEIFDGPSSSSELLEEFNGDSNPFVTPVRSTGSAMFVRFTTGPANVALGFKAVFFSDPACLLGGRTVPFDVTITSRYFPYGYSSNEDCLWAFDGFGQRNIFEVTFSGVNTEGSDTDCNSDYIELYVDSVAQERLCGYHPSATYTLTGAGIGLAFRSNDVNSLPGFSVRVKEYAIFENSRLNGGLLQSADLNTQELCLKACQARPWCEAIDFSSSNNTCSFHPGFTRSSHCDHLIQDQSVDHVRVKSCEDTGPLDKPVAIWSYDMPGFSIGYNLQSPGETYLDQLTKEYRVISPGITGLPESVSFEAIGLRGYYLRAETSSFYTLNVEIGVCSSNTCKNQDSTFTMHRNLWRNGTIAFRSTVKTNYYIRHTGTAVIMGIFDGSSLFMDSASFIVE